MTALVAFGAISALGEGEAALGVVGVGELAPHRVMRDDELAAAGLAHPWCARARVDAGAIDRATALLRCALLGCAHELDRAMPTWREKRVGLAIGTSSGGMRAFEAGAGGFEGTYLAPVIDALFLSRPLAVEPFALVLGACASGTLAVGLARAWLREGRCDVALCGGFDAVSVFVASGFEVLRAVCTERGPRPFRNGRDGLALGEGAAVLALTNDPPNGSPPIAWVDGFGASCDATHLTAPDPRGDGLARAAEAALREADAQGHIELVSAHGTATELNDASEAQALVRVVARDVPVHALKGATGHTLGAAGALEALGAAVAMRDSVAPASAGDGEASVRVLDRSEAHEARHALKLSSAFGGANAALVLTRGDGPRRASRAPARAVFVSRAAAVVDDAVATATEPASLAARTGYRADRIARADLLVRLALASVAALRDAVGALGDAGIVVGHGLATIDTNQVYLARIRAAGARRAEPRRFPYTTPNAAAGECAVAFGLRGPAFAVGGGPHGALEALDAAASLVASGAAERMVVVAADEAGAASRALAPGTRAGAVALLVAAEPLAARLESRTVRLEGTSAAAVASVAMDAHRAFLPLVSGRPDRLEAALPWGGFANARFLWL